MNRTDRVDDAESARLKPIGQGLFVSGIVLVALRGIELFTRMPGLPAFWSTNQPVWIAVGIMMTAMGFHLLWGRSMFVEASWRPSVPGQRFRTAAVYVRQGCHLCDEAFALLAAYQAWIPVASEIDIDADAKLSERFCNCVPVIMFDDKIRFRGKINETLLRRLIEGTPPLKSLPSESPAELPY